MNGMNGLTCRCLSRSDATPLLKAAIELTCGEAGQVLMRKKTRSNRNTRKKQVLRLQRRVTSEGCFVPQHHFRSSIEVDAATSKRSVIYNTEADASVCVDLGSLWANILIDENLADRHVRGNWICRSGEHRTGWDEAGFGRTARAQRV
jgi:hypothetical protein